MFLFSLTIIVIFIQNRQNTLQNAAGSFPDQTNYQSPYGVTTIHADQQLITDFHDVNIHWLRYQIAGTPSWASLDADVARLNAAGIHMDFSIHCLSGNCFSNPPLAPVSAYAALAAQLASRYNGTNGHGFIDAYEIGNEEFDFYPPSTYPPYLKAGCQAVKAANPNALCGMYGTYKPDLTHYSSVVNAIFSAGDGQYMDFMNFHYYVKGQNPANPGSGMPSFNQVWQAFHQIASKSNFPNMPVWVTEIGWPTAAVSCCQAVSPQTQSQYLQYIMDQSRTSGVVSRVYWFTMDYGDQGDSLDRTSTGRLPAFNTYQNYVAQFPSWTTIPSSPSPKDTITPTSTPPNGISPTLTPSPSISIFPPISPTSFPSGVTFCGATCHSDSDCDTTGITCGFCDVNGSQTCIASAPSLPVNPSVTSAITPTPIPSQTTTSTPTPTPGAAVGTLSVHFEGIDLQNNPFPHNSQRKVILSFFTSQNFNSLPLASISALVSFVSSDPNGAFMNNAINLSSIPQGSYYILIKSPEGSLREEVSSQPIAITPGQTVTLGSGTTPVNLRMGDLDNSNTIDLSDYNILIDCFGSKEKTAVCTNHHASDQIKGLYADLNDNGSVNGTAYNLLIRHFGETGY